MPCMCGDIRCWSCGPAQGNYKCDVCGRWSDEGGCINPSACQIEQEERDRKYVEELAEEERLAREFWAEEARLQAERKEQELCPHGKQIHECNDCMIASDHAYDAARERRVFGR